MPSDRSRDADRKFPKPFQYRHTAEVRDQSSDEEDRRRASEALHESHPHPRQERRQVGSDSGNQKTPSTGVFLFSPHLFSVGLPGIPSGPGIFQPRKIPSIPNGSQAVGFLIPPSFLSVGLPGIEPGLRAPHARVLPIYYSPSCDIILGTMERAKRKGGGHSTASIHASRAGIQHDPLSFEDGDMRPLETGLHPSVEFSLQTA